MSKSPPDHNLVIAAPRPVGVEVTRDNSSGKEMLAWGRIEGSVDQRDQWIKGISGSKGSVDQRDQWIREIRGIRTLQVKMIRIV